MFMFKFTREIAADHLHAPKHTSRYCIAYCVRTCCCLAQQQARQTSVTSVLWFPEQGAVFT